jgi:cysteinyl-tRNA synthetase
MVTLIQSLIDRGHAYVANGEVLFDTGLDDRLRPALEAAAGRAAGRRAHRCRRGTRRMPATSSCGSSRRRSEPGWDGDVPGEGRRPLDHSWPARLAHRMLGPCPRAYLGKVFDIHGGGLDLIFPHHENEIAQSRCAHGTSVMANYWLHNGFLQVEGKKMSKSEGNFVTIHELAGDGESSAAANGRARCCAWRC